MDKIQSIVSSNVNSIENLFTRSSEEITEQVMYVSQATHEIWSLEGELSVSRVQVEKLIALLQSNTLRAKPLPHELCLGPRILRP